MIDWTKPIQNYTGRPARVICTDRKSRRSDKKILVLVLYESGEEEVFPVSPEGHHGLTRNFIVNRPPYIWVVYKPDKPLQSFLSEDDAGEYFNAVSGSSLEATIVRYTVKDGVLTDAKVL